MSKDAALVIPALMRDIPLSAAIQNSKNSALTLKTAARVIKRMKLSKNRRKCGKYITHNIFMSCLYLLFLSCLSFIITSCGFVSSQTVHTNDQNTTSNGRGEPVLKSNSPNPPDDYEIAKAGAEKLNSEPVARIENYAPAKPLTRRQIREALLRSGLGGESKDGKVGGGKIAHFSHTCDLLVEGKLFHVVYVPVIIQLASFSRRYNHTLIYNDSMQMIHDLKVDDTPLFCDGNRLFFNDYDMTFSYGESAQQVKGNVLIFTNGAKDIEGRIASLNFYRFRDLIY